MARAGLRTSVYCACSNGRGIPVEIIVGSSVGSLVGALYAGPWNAQELEGIARRLGRDDFFDFGVHPALFGTGLASGRRIEKFVRENLSEDRIERLRIPFAAVATDLDSGNPVVLRAGDVARAVRASCAIPGVFEPVRIEGQLLVDGGLVQNLPVKVARDMGADVVIAVDVTAIGAAKAPRNFVEVILRAVNIVVHAEVEDARRDADVFLAPAVGEVGFIDFDRKLDAIAAGIASATAALPKIRQVLAEWERATRPLPGGDRRSAARQSVSDRLATSRKGRAPGCLGAADGHRARGAEGLKSAPDRVQRSRSQVSVPTTRLPGRAALAISGVRNVSLSPSTRKNRV